MEREQLLIHLMKSYGRVGVKEWNRVKERNRDVVQKRLNWPIAQHPKEVDLTITTRYSAESKKFLKFIPMSCDVDDFDYSFFLPIRERVDGADDKFSFDLFLVVKGADCLGFRWEPADQRSSRHCYGHIQMCKRMFRGDVETSGIPLWIPDSSPAFPISTSDPLRMFLSMAASIHGYGDHLTGTLRLMYPEGFRAKEYDDEWKRFLGILAD